MLGRFSGRARRRRSGRPFGNPRSASERNCPELTPRKLPTPPSRRHDEDAGAQQSKPSKSNSGQILPNSGKIWPKERKSRRGYHGEAPTSPPSRVPEFPPDPAEFGRNRDTRGRFRVTSGPNYSHSEQIWPTPGQSWPKESQSRRAHCGSQGGNGHESTANTSKSEACATAVTQDHAKLSAPQPQPCKTGGAPCR